MQRKTNEKSGGIFYVMGEMDRKRNELLVKKARELAISMDLADSGKVKLIFMGNEITDIYKKYEADEIVFIKCGKDRPPYGCSEQVIRLLADLAEAERADMILFPSNPQYRELAAALAVRMNRAVLTDCTDLWVKDSDYRGMKPSLDGRHFTEYRFAGEKPYLAVVKTVKTKTVSSNKALEQIRVIEAADSGLEKIRLLSVNCSEKAGQELENAQLIFAGGRGMMNEDSFLALRKLAQFYHASIAASRPAVDAGWADAAEQVGQTGSFVRPKVYLAFGISGAVQHIAGMKDSRHIIAVNHQKASPIFRYCDYGAYSDADSIVRNMRKLLEGIGETAVFECINQKKPADNSTSE